MKKFLFLILITLTGCSGQKELFQTNMEFLKPVPDLFKLGANSVIRNSESVLNIYDKSHAAYKEHVIVTVLNDKHRDVGELFLYYDEFRKLDYVNVQVRNNYGEVVGIYTLKDAEDYSASGSSFFTDVRVKVITAYHNSYPYTIEYEYKYDYHGTLNLPEWHPKSFEQSIENASFEIVDYTKGEARYFAQNIEHEPEVVITPEMKSIKWNLNWNLAQKSEWYSPPHSEFFPNVKTAVSDFKMGNSYGNVSSWKDFGLWYYTLSEGKRELPTAAKDEIDAVVAKYSGEKEKVIALYKYMQDQTRYVSIQLGLGGWEPFSAAYVYDKKYGDCKALVNFMHAILEYAGIKAEPVLIRNGINSPKVIAEFPSNQFNHVVLRVTLSSGEIVWLECTSKYLKPGRLGAGNEGKNVLVINENGGEIITTGLSNESDNRSTRILNIKLMEDGAAEIESNMQSYGIMEDSFLHQLMPVSEKKREEWLVNSIPLNNFKINSHHFEGLEKDDREAKYQLNLTVKDYASSTAKRLFVPVNKFNEWNLHIPEDEVRINEIHLPFKFSEMDSVIFELPEGFIVESLPKNSDLKKEFGSYQTNYTIADNKVIFKRELIINQPELPKEKYSDFKDFFNTVNKNDRAQLVVVKGE